MHCLAPNTSGDGTGCDNMTAIIVQFNFKRSSSSDDAAVSKPIACSPWPTMLSSVNNKRALSPDATSTVDIIDEINTKKVKSLAKNGDNDLKTVEAFSTLLPNVAASSSCSSTSSVVVVVENNNNNNSNDG
jgi:hypothetical protein